MIDQVTSIEQSKRLLELGVPAEKACMVWKTTYHAFHPILRAWDAGTDTKRWQVDNIGYVPAFTVADLIIMLPAVCGYFIIGLAEFGNNNKFIYYEAPVYVRGKGYEGTKNVMFTENSLVESCVKAIEWVVSNNYTLNI